MEIVLIIASICLSVFVAMFAAFKIADLEHDINMLQKQQTANLHKTNKNIDSLSDGLGKWIDEFADNNAKFYEDIKSIREEVDEKINAPLNYKTEVMKSAKAYIYLEMCYIRNQLKHGNIDDLCDDLEKKSAGDLYSKDLLEKGDMIDHE